MEEQSSSELILLEQETWVGTETKSELLIETSKETVCSVGDKEDWKESEGINSVAIVDVSSSLRMDCRTQSSKDIRLATPYWQM